MDLKMAFVSFLITFPPTRITCHIYTFEIQNSGDFSKQFEIQGPLTLCSGLKIFKFFFFVCIIFITALKKTRMILNMSEKYKIASNIH